jgi:hypothetical protein
VDGREATRACSARSAVRLRLSMTTPSWQDRRQERNEARAAKTTSSKTAAAASGIRTVVAIRLASAAFPLDASPRRRERPNGATTWTNACLRSARSGLMAHMPGGRFWLETRRLPGSCQEAALVQPWVTARRTHISQSVLDGAALHVARSVRDRSRQDRAPGSTHGCSVAVKRQRLQMSVLSESVPVLQQTTRGAKLGPVSSLTAMAGAPPSQAQSSGRERSWRRRVPTALLVTLLGIGLTAWILPAFTRQWDDRQKAHELKAAIVAESASATANVLTAAQRDVFTLTPRSTAVFASDVGPPNLLQRRWSVASLQLEAKFRAYFPERVQNLWRAYSAIVDYALARLYGYREGLVAVEDVMKYSQYLQREGIDISIRTIDGLQHARTQASDIFRRYPELRNKAKTIYPPKDCNEATNLRFSSDPERRAIQCLELQMQKQALLETVTTNLRRTAVGYRSLLTQLIAIQEKITAQVLRSHVNGYSTNWRDFLRGLGI